MKPRFLLPSLLLLPLAAGAATMDWPLMPDVPVLTREHRLDYREINAQLQSAPPPGQPGAGGAPAAPGGAGEPPVPVAVTGARHPVVMFSDSSYAPVPEDYVPVLVDWFEAAVKSMGLTKEQAAAAGLSTNKVAQLMRVFLGVRLRQRADTARGAVPAIGWGRFHFNEGWGRYEKGGDYTAVVIATERGWIVLDPYTRRARPLVKGDPRWVLEFLVL